MRSSHCEVLPSVPPHSQRPTFSERDAKATRAQTKAAAAFPCAGASELQRERKRERERERERERRASVRFQCLLAVRSSISFPAYLPGNCRFFYFSLSCTLNRNKEIRTACMAVPGASQFTANIGEVLIFSYSSVKLSAMNEI